MKEYKRSDPKVAGLIKTCYPSWRGRRSVKVEKRETYSMADYWDGGSRDYVKFVHVLTGHQVGLGSLDYEQQKMGNPFNQPIGKVKLTPDIIAVENVIFCGKDLGIRIYTHPTFEL